MRTENEKRESGSSNIFDPIIWLQDFKNASLNKIGFRELRQKIFYDTVETVLSGHYVIGNEKININKNFAPSETQFYIKPPRITENKKEKNTIFHVTETDCLEAAALLKKVGYHACVLNMANRQNPGGGVQNGAGAQEENLFRRSNIFRSLYQFADYAKSYHLSQNTLACYPLNRNTGGIYTKNVTVFRGSESQGYPFLHSPFNIAVVSVPAINKPTLVESKNKYYISDNLIAPTKEKIRTILRIAAFNNHDCIILGALGCGAFRNPPHHIAQLFHEVFHEEEFYNFFSLIVFAIIEDHNSNHSHNPQGNLIPFKKVFI